MSKSNVALALKELIKNDILRDVSTENVSYKYVYVVGDTGTYGEKLEDRFEDFGGERIGEVYMADSTVPVYRYIPKSITKTVATGGLQKYTLKDFNRRTRTEISHSMYEPLSEDEDTIQADNRDSSLTINIFYHFLMVKLQVVGGDIVTMDVTEEYTTDLIDVEVGEELYNDINIESLDIEI